MFEWCFVLGSFPEARGVTDVLKEDQYENFLSFIDSSPLISDSFSLHQFKFIEEG
jgi:hypothetical protein